MIFSKWNVSVSIVAVAFAVNAQWIEQTEPLPIPPEMALLVTGTMSPEDSLSLDALGNLSPVSGEDMQMRSMSFPEANPDASLVATLAEQLESYDKMFIYVCDRIKTEPYRGLIRSPEQTLLDGAGSPMEQAHLFSELCRAKYGSGATKFLEQTLTIPLQSDTGFDACDFTGVSNSTDAVNLLLNGNLLVSVTNTTVTIPWVLVGLQTTGGWYYFDPSLKTHAVPGSFDFYSAMGYSRTNLLASAGGTTNSAGWATSLNEGAITNLMNQFASGLLAVARTNSALLVEPGQILSAVRWAAGPLTMIPPYSNIADIATNSHGRIVLSGGGLSPLTLNTRETAHKKISIRFTTDGSYKAQIYLGDSASPVRTESSGGAYNTPFNLTVDTIHAGVTNSQPYSLKRGAGQYVLCQSFGGGCSSAMSGYISKTIAALKQRGYADNSPEVFTESLRYTGQRWMDQEANVQRYIQAISPKKTVVKYRIGIMAGETEGFFIDAKNGFTFSAGSTSGFIDSYVASALEHAVLEQLQPGNAKGISTIRIIKQANATNMPVYRANSNNWNAIKNNISNYSNKAQIESDIQNASGFFILPQSGSIAMGTNWSGNGYVMSKKVGTSTAYGMMIGGGYNGGYNAWKNPYVPKIQQTYTKPVYIPPIKTYSPPKSFDPVDMQSGAFLFDHTDLSLNGPLPLNLHRSYRSDNNTESVMGSGWNHSFNIYAAEHSAIDQSVGERSTEDMVPLLAGMAVIRNLLDNETGAKDWVAAAIVADWTVQQLTGNGVSVSLGSKALTFVKQPDGFYTPPPGMTVSLIRTNGVYVMQERNASKYTFNTNNLIAAIADPDGNTLTFSYDANTTNLQTVTSSFGPQMTFVYTSNRVTSVSDGSRTVYYHYDTKNNLTNFTDAAGKNWGAFYSNTNHPNAITSLKDPEGITTIQNSYNPFGQVTNQISATGQPYDLFITDYISVERNPFGQRTTYYYDDKGRTVQTQKPDGASLYSRYDGWDRVTNTVNEAGTVNVVMYDNQHNILQNREAVGTPQERVTGYGYDNLNRLRFVTNALGTTEQVVTEYTYTATHHVDTETQAKGAAEQRVTDYDYYSSGLLQTKTEPLRVTSYTYDSRGNPNTVASTDAGTVDYDFSTAGMLEQVSDQNQVETKYGYNALGLPTNTIYACGTSVQSSESRTYYGNGLLYTATDGRGKSITNTWTAAYKPSTVRYPDGGIVSNTYDAADRLVKVKDARQNTSSNVLDAIGRVVVQKGPGSIGAEQRFFYDVAGNVTNSAVDPTGLNLWRKTSYDALSRPLNQQSAIANQQFQYDSLGRVTNRIDAASKSWKSGYDALGRKTAAVRPSGATEQFVYDALGNRIGFYNAEGKPITFGFDAQGRVTAVTNAIGKVTRFTYDSNGNLTDRQDAKTETTHYDYNALNRLTNVVHAGQWKASFAYDANGNLLNQQSPIANQQFSYDSMNRLNSSSFQVSGFTSQVSSAYDLNGNRTNITYPGGVNVSYGYDAENRLTGATVTGSPISTPLTFSFGYDGASRLTSLSYPNGINSAFGYDAENKVVSYNHGAFLNHSITRDLRGYKTQEDIYAGLIPNFTNGLRQTRTHNDADQLLSAGANEYSYDPNGNLTNSANGIYQWNYDNRLVNAGSTEYLYDGSGSRIGRIANGVTNYFILDYKAPLKMPLAEADAMGNITRYYIWSSHGLLAHFDMNPTNGAVVATRYYHADEQGSTLALTDENGAVTDQFAYTPYGGVTHQNLIPNTSNLTPFLWLGGIAVQNEGDGLYFMLNRYYSATTKKFISVDPSGIDGGANLYAYASLNPNANVDPFGLCSKPVSSSSFTLGSYNNVVSSATGINTSYKAPSVIQSPQLSNYVPGRSSPAPTLQSYQNSQQYLAHDALLIGSSAKNPVLAQANAAPFAIIGGGALLGSGSSVLLPAIKAASASATTYYLQNAPQINQAVNGYFNVPGVEQSSAGQAGQAIWMIQETYNRMTGD